MTARLTLSTTLSPSTKLATDQTETVYGTITSLKPKNVKDDQTTKLPSSITSIPNEKTSTFPTVIPSTTGWLKRPRDFINEKSTLPVTVSSTRHTTTVPSTETASTRVSFKRPRDFINEKSTALPTTTASTTEKKWRWSIAKPEGSDKMLSTAPATIKQTTKSWNNFFKQKSTTLPATTPGTSITTKRPIDKLISDDKTSSTVVPSTTEQTTKHKNIFKQKSTTSPVTTPSPSTTTKHRIEKLIGGDKTRTPSITEQTTKNSDHLFKEKRTIPTTTKPTTRSWQEIRKSTTVPSTTTTKHPTTIIDEQKFTKNASTTPSTAPPPKKRKIDDEIPLVFIPSRTEDPVSFEIKQILIKETNKYIHQQSVLESKASMDTLRAIHKEKEIRYAMNSIKLRRLQQHPFFHRMLKEVTKEMIYERKDWRKYWSNPLYKDTITSRRRIQPEISDYFLAYAIKFDKRPWLNPGKNRIKTKFYERVDFVDKPFIITEEKTETTVQHEIVKAKTK